MLNLYRNIHKAQRAWMERALVAVGRADAAGRSAAFSDVAALIDHLKAHAEHEERFIDPLLRAVAPAIAARLHEEHGALDAVLEDLDRRIAVADVDGIYRGLALLTAQYFLHLDAEEYEAMPLLSQAYTDDQLRERVFVPFAASRQREEITADLRLQLLALNANEAQQLLAAVAGH